MKKVILFFYIFAAGSLSAQNKDYPIQGVPFTQVKLADKFWLPRKNIRTEPEENISFNYKTILSKKIIL